jgi:hypothetical protein
MKAVNRRKDQHTARAELYKVFFLGPMKVSDN